MTADERPEESSTFVGTFPMPVNPHAADTAAGLEATVRNLVEAARADDERKAEEDELRRLNLAAARRRAKTSVPAELGRPAGATPVPLETFWPLLRLAVDGASGRALEKATLDDPSLSFVNRHKAGDLKRWVDAHPRGARDALAGPEIPRSFRTTRDGVIIPKRPPKP